MRGWRGGGDEALRRLGRCGRAAEGYFFSFLLFGLSGQMVCVY